MNRTRAIMRKIVRIGIIVAAFLVCLLALVLLVLSLSPGEKFLRDIIEDRAASALGQPVTIGNLETNVLSRIVLHDMRVLDTLSGDSLPVLEIDTIHIEYSLLPLIHKTLRIESVDIDSLAVHLHRDQSGSYNFRFLNQTTVGASQDSVAGDETGSGFAVDISRLSLGFSILSYDDNTLPARIMLHDGSIDVNSIDTSGYRFAVHADALDAAYDGIPLHTTAFDMQGTYGNTCFCIDTFALVSDQFDLGAEGSIALDSTNDISGRVLFRGQPNEVIQRLTDTYGIPQVTLHDTVWLRAEISGNMNSPVVSGGVTVPKTDIGKDRIAGAYVAARWRADSVTIDSLHIRAFSGSLAGAGRMKLDTIPGIHAGLVLTDVSMDELWERIYGESSPYTGRVSGDISIDGYSTDILGWDLSASLAMQDGMYRSKPFADFTITASLSDGNGRIDINQRHIDISVAGRFEPDDLDLGVEAEINRIEPLAALVNYPGVTGRVGISGSVTGSLKSPTAQADISAYDIRYRNIPVDSLVGSIRYDDSMLYLQDVRFAGRIDSVTPVTAPYEIDLTAGNVEIQGRVSGPVDSLAGLLSIAFDNASYGGYTLDAGGVSARLNGMRAVIDSFWAVKRDGIFRSYGDFDVDDLAGNMTVHLYTRGGEAAEELETADIPDLEAAGSIETTFDLSDSTAMAIAVSGRDVDIERAAGFLLDSLDVGGKANFTIDFSGSIEHPYLIGSVFVRDPRYGDVILDSVLAAAIVEDKLVHLQELSAHASGLHLTAETSLQLLSGSTEPFAIFGDSPIRGKMEADVLDLSSFNPMLDAASLSGQASIDIEWNGTVTSPHVSGRCTLDSVVVAMSDPADSIYNVYLDGTLRDSVFTIDSARGVLLREPFTLDGSVTVSEWRRFWAEADLVLERIGTVALRGMVAPDSIDMYANIDHMELDLLAPFIPSIDSLAGMLACSVSIAGKPDDPQLAGTFSIDNLSFQPVMARAAVKNGIVRLSFDKQRVRIDTISAALGGGRVAMSGGLEHDQGEIKGINLALQADDVRISKADVFRAHIESAEFTYTNENEYYILDGDVKLGESRLTQNFPLQSILPWAKSVERVESDLPSFLKQTRLDIRLRGSDQLWIDNNLARIRLSSDLTFVGTVPQPNFTGRVNVEEGYVLYLDREFAVTEGILYFVDHFKFNPEVSLRAETKVKTYEALAANTYTIVVSVKGQLLGDRIIELTSEPPLERPDIVSLLTLGATRQQLAGTGENGEGGASTVLTQRAQMLTSRQVSGFVSGKVGSLLGLDRVSVEGNLFDIKEGSGPQISATKRLSERIELTYTTTVGYMNEHSIEVGYQFWKRLYFVGQTNRTGKSSIDLKYRLRFR